MQVAIGVNPVTIDPKQLNAKKIMLPIGKAGDEISLFNFSRLKCREYEKLANVKLGFIDRIFYKLAMRKLRKGIAADGTIVNKKLQDLFSPGGKKYGFNAGGFSLGFLLNFIGLLIACLAFKDEKRQNRIKWAWIGLVSVLTLAFLFILAVAVFFVKKG